MQATDFTHSFNADYLAGNGLARYPNTDTWFAKQPDRPCAVEHNSPLADEGVGSIAGSSAARKLKWQGLEVKSDRFL